MDFLRATWSNLIMANYPVDEDLLAPYLPYGTELDLFQGKAYMSLVGFMFMRSRVFGVRIPWVGSFEEVNLRFYVIRREAGLVKRGVVFINETVPHGAVAWAARRLYNERYTAMPVQHKWQIGRYKKQIEYRWYQQGVLNSIAVEAGLSHEELIPGSFEEFILEHYYGYTRLSGTRTAEYRISHPRWTTNQVLDSAINVDFTAMYGKAFGGFTAMKPAGVLLAEGSDVTVQWERTRIQKPDTIYRT